MSHVPRGHIAPRYPLSPANTAKAGFSKAMRSTFGSGLKTLWGTLFPSFRRPQGLNEFLLGL